MKTKDFIKMLQEADPSGEAYVRMGDGFPMYVEKKLGYWDGPFSYVDEDGNFVTSINGFKIDVGCFGIDDFVERHFDQHDPNNWEKIKSKFKFELGYSIKQQEDEYAERVLKYAKECYDQTYEINKSLYDESLEKMIENSKKGWTWFQNKDVDLEHVGKHNMHIYYTWKIYDENGKQQPSNLHCTESIQHSGLWEKIDNGKLEGCYQWIFKQ